MRRGHVRLNQGRLNCEGLRRLSDLTGYSEEQRFQLLVNAVIDYAIYMLDPDGRIATWNPGAERFKGYKADEIIGEHFSRFFSEEDRAADLPGRALRIAAREGRFEAEGWRIRKDGSRFWAHSVLDQIRAPDGSLLGFAKITRDITDKQEREKALYESEQRFRMLVEGVRDYAIYMLDVDGRITNWNSGAQLIKGYTASEIVGQHFSRFYTDEDRARGEPKRALNTALSEGKYEREAWRVRKDGSLFWANVLIDPIYDENGEHVGFAKITRDATERKRAQEELEAARIALAQSQKLQALGELTGGVAHDFNNLMTVIRGSADLLTRTGLSEEKRARYLRAIIETADRLEVFGEFYSSPGMVSEHFTLVRASGLTQVGPGTPMGELMRRYWQPIALAEELPERGAPPTLALRVRLVLTSVPGPSAKDTSNRSAMEELNHSEAVIRVSPSGSFTVVSMTMFNTELPDAVMSVKPSCEANEGIVALALALRVSLGV